MPQALHEPQNEGSVQLGHRAVLQGQCDVSHCPRVGSCIVLRCLGMQSIGLIESTIIQSSTPDVQHPRVRKSSKHHVLFDYCGLPLWHCC